MHKQYIQKDQGEFWRENWERFSLNKLVKNLDRTDLWRTFKKYLPKGGKILEGGCGLGHWVKFLRLNGYDAIGVEYVKEIVLRAKEFDPTLPIYEGDITSLRFPDDTFDAYLSLGVIEHFEDGPEKALLEAKRVLKSGCKLLISVPYLNFSKRLINLKNSLLKRNSCLNNESKFYQHIYKKDEFKRCLEETGFKIIAIYAYAADAGLQNRFPIIGKVKERFKEYKDKASLKGKAFCFLRELYYRGARYIPKSIFAHMIIAICENEK